MFQACYRSTSEAESAIRINWCAALCLRTISDTGLGDRPRNGATDREVVTDGIVKVARNRRAIRDIQDNVRLPDMRGLLDCLSANEVRRSLVRERGRAADKGGNRFVHMDGKHEELAVDPECSCERVSDLGAHDGSGDCRHLAEEG